MLQVMQGGYYMIPDYCFDCMNRQIPMSNAPGATPMPQGYPMGGMYQQPNTYQTPGMYQSPGMYQAPVYGPVQGQLDTTMQAPFGMQGAQAGVTPQMQMPMTQTLPADFGTQAGPAVQMDIGYTQGWLRTQIGQRVKIEFLIGTNMLIDRDGTLLDVGISYVILREAETDDLLLCDIYSIKFVRVYL